eukprot:3700310-Pleurochrysis_carterae.AAC.1
MEEGRNHISASWSHLQNMLELIPNLLAARLQAAAGHGCERFLATCLAFQTGRRSRSRCLQSKRRSACHRRQGSA